MKLEITFKIFETSVNSEETFTHGRINQSLFKGKCLRETRQKVCYVEVTTVLAVFEGVKVL